MTLALILIFSALSILCTGIAIGSCMKVDDITPIRSARGRGDIVGRRI